LDWRVLGVVVVTVVMPIVVLGVDRRSACFGVLLAVAGHTLRPIGLGRGACLRMCVAERREFGVVVYDLCRARLWVFVAELRAILILLGGLVRAALGMLTALSRLPLIGRRRLVGARFGVIRAQRDPLLGVLELSRRATLGVRKTPPNAVSRVIGLTGRASFRVVVTELGTILFVAAD
jgi:hypothetical protein